MPVAPQKIYLLDPAGGTWLVGCTDIGQVQIIAQPAGTPGVSAFLLSDVSQNQLWRLAVAVDPTDPANMTLQTVSTDGSCAPKVLLVNSPNGTLYGIQVSNGLMQTIYGNDCVYSFAQLRTELANRLNDPQKVFWTDAELGLQIQNALRFWNVLTGDNRTWYSLQLTEGTVWYDLQSIPDSPRLSNVQDADLYSWLQFALMEPQQPNAALGTAQFVSNDLIQSVQRKRDEFIFRTGCTSTVRNITTTPNVSRFSLPNTVIQTRRAYWMPAVGQAYPLMRSDEWVTMAYEDDFSSADPDSFSAGMEPPLQVSVTPKPNQAGQLELLTIESQGLLQVPCPTTLMMPSDFAPAVMWGALYDLMSIPQEAQDQLRARYAKERFDQFVELLKHYPSVLQSTRVDDSPIYVDAVETLDLWDPYWRNTSANPDILGLSGQNLVAYPTDQSTQNISLFMLANADIPIQDNDCVLLGRELIDAILDYSVHTSLFKVGGAEFVATFPLLKHILQMAGQRNTKLNALSTFRPWLYGTDQREDQIAPSEKSIDGQS
jgi:hypothetical protein